jgi:DNA-binding NtrC family response regulator
MYAEPADARLILIVDDEHLIRWSLGEHFSDLGHRVLLAQSLQVAREHLAEMPHLLLLDVSLPDGSGLEFLGEIHALHPDLPVIVLSGHASREVALVARQNGAKGVLQKPYAFEMLDALVGKLSPEWLAAVTDRLA